MVIKINGWLFSYFPNRPIVIIVHGLFPNGKCKPESNLIASLLIQQKINALTIDLRNYGQSDTVSKYENLGLRSYNDVLGAFDFLKQIFSMIFCQFFFSHQGMDCYGRFRRKAVTLQGFSVFYFGSEPKEMFYSLG